MLDERGISGMQQEARRGSKQLEAVFISATALLSALIDRHDLLKIAFDSDDEFFYFFVLN
jgi:hypothetical protein